MEVMFVNETQERRFDVYLRTRSGRSLPAALAAAHRFGGDVSEYAPPAAARHRVLAALYDLYDPVDEARVGLIDDDGYVIRVHGLRPAIDEALRPVAEYVEAVEPADRWQIEAAYPKHICRIFGHDWQDLILIGGGYGLFECSRCPHRWETG